MTACKVARLGEKVRIWALSAAVSSLKFGFGALLLFVLLFKSLATTSGEFLPDTFLENVSTACYAESLYISYAAGCLSVRQTLTLSKQRKL